MNRSTPLHKILKNPIIATHHWSTLQCVMNKDLLFNLSLLPPPMNTYIDTHIS